MPWRQQSQNMAKILKSYILTLPQTQGHWMSWKGEEHIDELTVQVLLLYHYTNLKYYTMDFLLSKYGLIFTEFDSIDRGGAKVNTFKFSKYQTIFTE